MAEDDKKDNAVNEERPRDGNEEDDDEEEIITMQDVIDQEEELEDEAFAVLGASDDKNCSYTQVCIRCLTIIIGTKMLNYQLRVMCTVKLFTPV